MIIISVKLKCVSRANLREEVEVMYGESVVRIKLKPVTIESLKESTAI